MRVLAVVAHPDDESLAMGASLAKHVADGDEVHVAVLCDGVGARFDLRASHGEYIAAAKARAAQFHAACDALAIQQDHRYECRVFEDQRSDRVAQLSINREVEGLVTRCQPERVYTHFVGDVNVDHRRVSEAVQVATRGVCDVWCAEPEWPARYVGRQFEPYVRYMPPPLIVDRKLAACACYVDELRDPPHPRSLQEIRKRTEKGEAFEVIR